MWGDFGYSGWIQKPDGEFLWAYHRSVHEDPNDAPAKWLTFC